MPLGSDQALDKAWVQRGDKVKSRGDAPKTLVKIITALGAIAVAVLFIFGVIFAFASVYAPTRLIVAALLFIIGFGIAYYISRQPKTIIQKVEFSGQMEG